MMGFIHSIAISVLYPEPVIKGQSPINVEAEVLKRLISQASIKRDGVIFPDAVRDGAVIIETEAV